jgi:RNA polymerase sigma-70 factor (ECF subfamily)
MGEPEDREKVLVNSVNAANAATQPSSGDPAVELEQVYREHQTRVLRAAYRITGNAQDAEDVLQTVFMRLARREGGSPLSDSPGSYLHRAAINAALDVVRSRPAQRSTALEDVEPVLASAERDSPEKRQGAGEIRSQIQQALSKMSPKSAEIFALRYFEGFGNHEIARMLGTSRSTVNVILHRTRQRLKDDIAAYVGEAQ